MGLKQHKWGYENGNIPGLVMEKQFANLKMTRLNRNSGFSQLENDGSFHSYVSLPEGIHVE